MQNGTEEALAFEAQVGLHLPLYAWSFGNPDPTSGINHELRILYSFQTRLRMTTADSAPVITLSYMPTLRLQWLGRRTIADRDRNPKRDWRFGATLDVWSHHSNGQDGCTFLPLSTTPGNSCTSAESATALNEQNGSFATNYLGLTGHVRHSWGATHETQRLSLIGLAGIQFHHGFPAGGLDSDLVGLWGRWHALAGVELRGRPVKKPDHWWSSGYIYARYRLDLMLDGGSDERIPDIEARRDLHIGELGWIWPELFGLGLFVRVVGGRDYYNIQFTQDVTRVQLGLVIDTSGEAPKLEVAQQPGVKVKPPGTPEPPQCTPEPPPDIPEPPPDIPEPPPDTPKPPPDTPEPQPDTPEPPPDTPEPPVLAT